MASRVPSGKDSSKTGFRNALLSLPALLVLIAAIALCVRVVAASHLPIGYDGYWHVFIARNLPREYRGLAHPPLFILMLRGLDSLKHAPLAYRAVPLLAGAGSVLLIGRILLKLRASGTSVALGAFAAAMSPTLVILSTTVESYMLCALFVLGSLVFYLDLVMPDAMVPLKSRLGFAGLASLAVLSHYAAGLFLAACLFAPLIAAITRAEYRHALRRALRQRWRADAATWAPPFLVGGVLFYALARPWVGRLSHLPKFYFDSANESPVSFLMRNLGNTFRLLSPIAITNDGAAAALLALFLAVGLWASATGTRRDSSWELRVVPATIFVALVTIGMLAGLAGKYPFGGAMRHQFLIFLFALLALMVALDRCLRALAPGPRRAALAVGILGVIVSASRGAIWLRSGPAEPGAAEYPRFWRQFPQARAIHVDQFNLVLFFINHHDWTWHFEGIHPANPKIERYGLWREGRQLALLAHRNRWKMVWNEPELFDEIRLVMNGSSGDCDHVFCLRQRLLPSPTEAGEEPRGRDIMAMARDAGLATPDLVIHGKDVFARFCAQGPPRTYPRPLVVGVIPPGTRARQRFQVQPGGLSAIAVKGDRFRKGVRVTLDRQSLETAFGNTKWITAAVPRQLYSKPGKLELRVVNPDGSSSNPVFFEVLP